MPFNFKQYSQQCSHMSKYELRREIEHQNDTIATAGAGSGFALLAIPLTMGISAVALGGTAPAIINARKKRAIARKYMETAPDDGPNVSLRPSASTPRPTRPPVVRRQTPDDQLPAYVEVDEEASRKAKEMYGAEANTEAEMEVEGEVRAEIEAEQEMEREIRENHEVLPTYDEATIRRLTMMGFPPAFNVGVQGLESLRESTAEQRGGCASASAVAQRPASRSSSTYSDEAEGHHASSSDTNSIATATSSSSSSTLATPRTPRTPSPHHDDTYTHESICLLGDEIPHTPNITAPTTVNGVNGKGKAPVSNPFLSLDDEKAELQRARRW